MSRSKEIVIGLVIVILVFAGLLYATRNKKITSNIDNGQGGTLPKEVNITLNKNGFTPQSILIKDGTAVRWINKSGSAQTVNSDNYPTNQLHKELNFGVFNPGSSVVYTFTKPGIYGYHNQFNHEQDGKIVVVQ